MDFIGPISYQVPQKFIQHLQSMKKRLGQVKANF